MFAGLNIFKSSQMVLFFLNSSFLFTLCIIVTTNTTKMDLKTLKPFAVPSVPSPQASLSPGLLSLLGLSGPSRTSHNPRTRGLTHQLQEGVFRILLVDQSLASCFELVLQYFKYIPGSNDVKNHYVIKRKTLPGRQI